jgi:hypothetical protein
MAGSAVVLLHEGVVLSAKTGGLTPLPLQCSLVVRRSAPRHRDLRPGRPADTSLEQQPVSLFPPWLGNGGATAGSAATVFPGSGTAVAAKAPSRRSVEFLLAGESVKRNRHLARFAAAAYLPTLLADPALDGLWRRKGGSLRKELIEACDRCTTRVFLLKLQRNCAISLGTN